MFQLIGKKLKEITPTLAEKYLAANIYEGQRPVRAKHLVMLRDSIESGRFLTGDIAIAKQGWNGNDDMLANGQHQCLAVIATGKPIVAVVGEYSCKTPEDFAILYRQFDNNAVRSLSEIAIPEARALGLQWNRRFISTVLAGVSFLEGQGGMHKNKRVESLAKYTKEGNFIHEIFSSRKSSECKHLSRGPVVAAMIKTFRKNSADAEIFWEQVCDGENLPGKSPALKLNHYLLSANVAVGKGIASPSLGAPAGYREMYGKCIVAWNAYRKGDTTALKFYADKKLPEAV
jgi:hypothetical protein